MINPYLVKLSHLRSRNLASQGGGVQGYVPVTFFSKTWCVIYRNIFKILLFPSMCWYSRQTSSRDLIPLTSEPFQQHQTLIIYITLSLSTWFASLQSNEDQSVVRGVCVECLRKSDEMGKQVCYDDFKNRRIWTLSSKKSILGISLFLLYSCSNFHLVTQPLYYITRLLCLEKTATRERNSYLFLSLPVRYSLEILFYLVRVYGQPLKIYHPNGISLRVRSLSIW